jgi:hypothetical protein
VQKDQFRRIISSDMQEGSFFINESMDQASDWNSEAGGDNVEGGGSTIWATPNRARASSGGGSLLGGDNASVRSDTAHSVIFTRNTGDSFDWGPITLSSISPISIVHGRPVETLQLMRTVS